MSAVRSDRASPSSLAAILLVALACLTVLASARAEEGFDGRAAEPVLGRAVPSDASFVLHARLDETSAKRFEPAWDALGRSGFLEELRSALHQRVEDAKHRKWLERDAPGWIALFRSLEPRKLLSREFVVAGRVDPGGREWIALFRVDPAERDAIVRSLEKVLYAFGSVSPQLELVHSERESESVTALYRTTLEPLEEKEDVPPFVLRAVDLLLSQGRDLSLAGKDDVVMLSTSGSLLNRSLQLLEGRGSDLGFAYTARRKEGLSKGLLAAREGAGFEMHAAPGALFPEVEALGAIASCVASGKLDGATLAYGFHAALAAEPKGEAQTLRKALAEAPPLAKILDRIPKDATGFYAVSGPRVGAVLDALASGLKKIAPGAADLLDDPRQRKVYDEMWPRGFFARLPEGWMGYWDARPAMDAEFQKLLDMLFAFMVSGIVGKAGGETRTETLSSGAVVVESKLKDKAFYMGWWENRMAFSSVSRDAVIAALEKEPAPGGAEIVKRLEAPAGAVEAFDIEEPPRLMAFSGAVLLALFQVSRESKPEEEPILTALRDASKKLSPALEALRSLVDRSRGTMTRDDASFRGKGTVTFRN